MKRKKRLFSDGRPTLYRAAYAEQARKLCLLGYTDAELADFFSIDVSTLTRWKQRHPKFCTSIKHGKAVPDAEVAASLLHRAMGYSHPAVKIMQKDGGSFEHKYTEHYPPDTAAGIFWLKNRQPMKWRDRSQTEITGVDGAAVMIQNVMQRTREIAKQKETPGK